MSEKQVVHVIDDDLSILASVAGFLMTSGFGVQTYVSAQEFLESIGPHTTGCVVTDVRMQGISGIELVGKLKERHIALPIIIITAYADIALAIEAMKRGAVDLLEKPFNNGALVDAIHEAMANRSDKPAVGPQLEMTRTRLSTLTAREKEVLDRLLKGMPNKIIAHELGVSTRTIETHRATVMSKMNATSLAELVRMSLGVPGNN
jgi:two-component system, LuxR family, response regulator FixJ